MKKINFKQIDLLRKRREEDNFANPFFIETKKYIKKGIFIGLIIIAISLISGIPFIYRIKVLENKKNKIRVFSDEYDLLEKKLMFVDHWNEVEHSIDFYLFHFVITS